MKREKELLAIIRNNPLITQGEIAEKMGITRSTVGVHILNLQKKGLILGRGYIFDDSIYVCGVGSCNIDIYGKSNTRLRANYDHPSHITTNVGGVTHNILANLVKLGVSSKFVSAVGDDIYADAIIAQCEREEIDVSHVLHLENTTSGIFLQILDENNDMHLAMTEFDSIRQLSRDFLNGKSNVITGAKCVVCDPGLPVETIKALLDMGVETFCDPTSEALTDKIKEDIGRFFFIKPNKKELAVLADMEVNTEKDVEEACNKLIEKGLKHVCVSLGETGSFYMNSSGKRIRKHVKADDQMVNASGAGDAFMAGIIYSYVNGFDIETALDYASAAGKAAVRCNSTINDDLSVSLIEKIMEEK